MQILIYMAENRVVGGLLGDWLGKLGKGAEAKLNEWFLLGLGWIGGVLLYVSIIMISFGVYCLIFKSKKLLKIGFICFMLSLLLIVLGGTAE